MHDAKKDLEGKSELFLDRVVVRFGRPNGIVDGPHFDLIGARIK
jgi:hypothetical protein